MNREIIATAQSYLTIKENGKSRKIVDIDRLLKSHSSQEVIDFLKIILKEKQIALGDYVLVDKTSPEIDKLIVELFRINMSIKVLEDGKEVTESARAQRTAGGGG